MKKLIQASIALIQLEWIKNLRDSMKTILKSIPQIALALLLVMVPLGSTLSPASASNDEIKADPRLLQMAEDNPKDTFLVIVQKDVKNRDLQDMEVEEEVLKGGGQVKRKWDLIVSFSAELTGKEITKLAKHPKVRWISADAPMASTGSPGMDSVRDEFSGVTYAGNAGTRTWSRNWTEGDQFGDAWVSTADTGVFKVAQSSRCAGGTGYCLHVAPDIAGAYIYREADLSGQVSVWLSFYRNNLLNSSFGTSLEQVQLQVSSNGGKSWTTLATYSGTSKLGAATESFDISAYASVNTRIRFLMPSYQSGTRYIYFDDIQILFARSSAFLSAVKADQMSLNGQGITVAVVDSGILSRHADFSTAGTSRVIAETYFGNRQNAKDDHGHGTHVAGIIGGNGAASGGLYRGVAPGVNMINLRVADKDGMTYESSVLDSLEWIYNNKDVYNIRVVNLSLNSTVAQSYHTSPLDAAVELLWFKGIVVVVSAGNNGTGEGPVTLFPPANDPFVITVGATEDKGTASLADDNLAVFSAYGITEDGISKPELVAPGRNVIAPLSEKAATIYNAHPLHRVGDYYFRMSGTSMSAPIVSGAVALLLQDEPYLTPDQVKYRLMATANYDWCGFVSLDFQVISPEGVIIASSNCNAGYLDVQSAVSGISSESANTGIVVSQMLSADGQPIVWDSVGWNTVGWNTVGWNTVGWNTVGWNTSTWDD